MVGLSNNTKSRLAMARLLCRNNVPAPGASPNRGNAVRLISLALIHRDANGSFVARKIIGFLNLVFGKRDDKYYRHTSLYFTSLPGHIANCRMYTKNFIVLIVNAYRDIERSLEKILHANRW